MNNLLNTRVKKLIKGDLLAFGGSFLGVLVFGITSSLFNFWLDGPFIGPFTSLMIGSIFSFHFFALCMALTGITIGYELPQYIRRGVARKEYFIARGLVVAIESLLFAPIMLILNVITNLLVSSESLFYNVFHIGNGHISTLIMHFLIYITLFLAGFLISIFWQRSGWKFSLLVIIPLVLVSNALISNFLFLTLSNSYTYIRFSLEDGFSSSININPLISNGLINMILIGLIALLGIGIYSFLKHFPVKIK